MSESVRATVAMVATRAGVSVASVSRVLNGLPATPSMTERVRSAAAELNYVPDASARSLRAGRSFQIAFAVADIGNPAYLAMLRAVEGAIKPNYRVLLYSSADEAAELAFVRSLRSGMVDGLILQTLQWGDELLEAIDQLGIPTATIGTIPGRVRVDNVRTDSAMGIGLAVEHLINTGRRRLALLNGPICTAPGEARQRGFEDAMKAHGGHLETDLIIECDDFTHQAGYAAAVRLLERREPDAIVCANDLIAMGALRALSERGLQVPGDVAVTGMDDTDLAPMCNPPLTSVSLAAERRAKTAVDLLLKRMADPSRPIQRRRIGPELTVRASSSPARTHSRP